ncbi:restriction endonuclease subunit S [Flavobacterium davisii]|uniref:restriction endonuclease subunit S n=1 Tax=Flavobacterium davisii TaxID=2906077 RepID=UPI0035D00322
MSNNSRQYFREDSFFDVPKEGDIIALKFICNDFSKYGANLSAENYSTDGSRFIRTSDIDEDGKLSVDGVYIDEDLALEYKLKKGDFLLSRSGTLGRGYLYNELDGNCSYAGYLIKYSLNELIVNPKFIFYCTKTSQFNGWLNYSVIEATIGNINGEKYANLPLPIPTLEQQNKIVNYLDREIAKIDALIEKKTKLIALLEEKKKAVINQAVTKGLDTTVAMKDSGIEWLGEIPEHWEVVKLKYLVNKIDELNYADVEHKIAVENIIGFSGKLTNLESFNYEGITTKFKKNDIIFNKLRPYLGKVYLAKEEGGVYGELLVLRPNEKLVSKFLFYVMISTNFIDLVNSSTTGAKMPRASWEDFIKHIDIPLISIDEQQNITDFLEIMLTKNEELSNRLLSSIELLKEKRTTIISAAINGKINLD